jgi:hypothetical protein
MEHSLLRMGGWAGSGQGKAKARPRAWRPDAADGFLCKHGWITDPDSDASTAYTQTPFSGKGHNYWEIAEPKEEEKRNTLGWWNFFLAFFFFFSHFFISEI